MSPTSDNHSHSQVRIETGLINTDHIMIADEYLPVGKESDIKLFGITNRHQMQILNLG